MNITQNLIEPLKVYKIKENHFLPEYFSIESRIYNTMKVPSYNKP